MVFFQFKYQLLHILIAVHLSLAIFLLDVILKFFIGSLSSFNLVSLHILCLWFQINASASWHVQTLCSTYSIVSILIAVERILNNSNCRGPDKKFEHMRPHKHPSHLLWRAGEIKYSKIFNYRGSWFRCGVVFNYCKWHSTNFKLIWFSTRNF